MISTRARLLANGLVFAAIIGGGWWLYRHIDAGGYDRCQGEQAQALAGHIARAQDEARAIALQDAEVLSWGDRRDTEIRTIFRTLYLESAATPERDCSLSPAGRVLWNRANRAASTAASAYSLVEAGPVAGPAGTADAGDAGTDANQPHPGHGTDGDLGQTAGGSAPNAEGARAPHWGWN